MPPEQAELQKLVTENFEQIHCMHEELRAQPGIHTGDTSLADVMEYGPFRPLYPDWKLLSSHLVKQDEILLKVQHALTQVPNRDQVTKELENCILQTPPASRLRILRP